MAKTPVEDKIKVKTLKLSTDISDKDGAYKVLQLKNSTKYVPGQFIPKADVDAMCEAEDWDVTIVK